MKRLVLAAAAVATFGSTAWADTADPDVALLVSLLAKTECKDLNALMGEGPNPDGSVNPTRVALNAIATGFALAKSGSPDLGDALGNTFGDIVVHCFLEPGATMMDALLASR